MPANIFVFLEANPFPPEVVRQITKNKDKIPVRRPLMGLSINEETHATLQVIAPNPASNTAQWIPIINSSTTKGEADGTSNFIIVNVTHPRQEKVQIVQSFADDYLYVYGEEPKILNVQGVLLKSKNFPWRSEWLRNYDETFRVSRAVDQAARIFLTVADTVYQGHMLGCQVVDQAEQPLMAPMQFTMYLTDVHYAPGDFEADSESFVRSPEILNDAAKVLNTGPLVLDGFEIDADGTARLTGPSGQERAANPYRVVDLAALADHLTTLRSGGEITAVDPVNLLRAAQLLELRRSGFAMGDGATLGSDALRLQRLFTNGVGGYASRIDTSGDELNNILSDFRSL